MESIIDRITPRAKSNRSTESISRSSRCGSRIWEELPGSIANIGAKEYLAEFSDREGILFIGKARSSASNPAPRRFHTTRCHSPNPNGPINQTSITKFQSCSTAPGILRHSLTGTDRAVKIRRHCRRFVRDSTKRRSTGCFANG